MNHDFEWRVQKTDCMQKVDCLYREADRMSGKFVSAIEQEQLRDMIKLARSGDLEDYHFQKLDEFSCRDLEQDKHSRQLLEKLMKIIDLHATSTIKEAKKALDEARQPTTKLTNEELADNVGHRIVEKYTKMKREFPSSSGSVEGDRKRSKSVNMDRDRKDQDESMTPK